MPLPKPQSRGSESTHPDDVDYPGGLEKLARDLSHLRYDALTRFLYLLGQNIKEDSDRDQGRGRVILAAHLSTAGTALLRAGEDLGRAWLVCRGRT